MFGITSDDKYNTIENTVWIGSVLFYSASYFVQTNPKRYVCAPVLLTTLLKDILMYSPSQSERGQTCSNSSQHTPYSSSKGSRYGYLLLVRTLVIWFYTPDESRAYYGMGRSVRPSACLSVNIWLSTGVATRQSNLNFTEIIHLVGSIHNTCNRPCSSFNMSLLTQLLIFAFWSFLKPFFSG